MKILQVLLSLALIAGANAAFACNTPAGDVASLSPAQSAAVAAALSNSPSTDQAPPAPAASSQAVGEG